MSTVIKNGWLVPAENLTEVFERFHSIRGQVAAEGRAIIAGWFAKEAAKRVDLANHRGETCDEPLSGLYWELIERQRNVRATRQPDPEIDLECSVSVIPYDGRFLALVYAEHDTITNLITDGLVAFPYWNNTDGPKELSAAAWEERRQLWEGAIGRDPAGRPGNAGMMIEFLPDPARPGIDEILDQQPSLEDRSQWLAESVAIQEATEAMGPEADASSVWRFLWSEEYRARVREISHNTLNGLRSLTLDDLKPGRGDAAHQAEPELP